MAGEGMAEEPSLGRRLGKTAKRGRCEGEWAGEAGRCACWHHCLKTFHFHLRADSLPCNLHLCSYSCAPRPWFPGQLKSGPQQPSDQGGLGH